MKPNQIPAIPQLLWQVELTNIVTIDAMGCQKSIARDIVAGSSSTTVFGGVFVG